MFSCCKSRNYEEIKPCTPDTVAQSQATILLLGAGESGKSTWLKQLRLLYLGGFSNLERQNYLVVIAQNLTQSCLKVCTEMQIFDENYEYLNNLKSKSELSEMTMTCLQNLI